MTAFDLQLAHGKCIHHRPELEASSLCGCFYCLATFVPGEIVDWCDDGNTGLCPKCGVDSVLGDSSGYPIAERDFLGAMKTRWFGAGCAATTWTNAGRGG